MKTPDDALYPTIRDYLRVHLAKLRNLSEHTVRSYANALTEFVEYVSRQRPIPMRSVAFADFTKRSVCDFLDHLENERKRSVATRNLRLNAIRGFLSYAASCDVSAVAIRNDVATVPFKKPRQSGIVQHMTTKAVSAIFTAVDMKSQRGFRDLCLLAMLYDTGARVQELLDIRLADVDLGKSPTVMLRGKGRKTRVVPMSVRMASLLREYVSRAHCGKTRDSEDNLFFTVRNGCPTRMTEDNVRHLARHYGTMALQGGPEKRPSASIPALAGNASLRTWDGSHAGVAVARTRAVQDHAHLRQGRSRNEAEGHRAGDGQGRSSSRSDQAQAYEGRRRQSSQKAVRLEMTRILSGIPAR